MEQMLRMVVGTGHGRVGGLFAARSKLALVASYKLQQEDLDRVFTWWAENPGRLAAGSALDARTWCLRRFDGPQTTLLVYVGGATAVDVVRVGHAFEEIADLVEIAVATEAGESVEAVSSGSLDEYLGDTPIEVVERRHLMVVLDRFEWNVARVGRFLGVTRVTVYNRMARLGITRIRVRKNVQARLRRGASVA
jgi:hypothetical protein